MVENPSKDHSITDIFQRSEEKRSKLKQLRRQYEEHESNLSNIKDQLVAKLKGKNLTAMNHRDLFAAYELLYNPSREQISSNDLKKARNKIKQEIVNKLEKEIISRLTSVFNTVGLTTISIQPKITEYGLDFDCTINNQDSAGNDKKLSELDVDVVRQTMQKEDNKFLLIFTLEAEQVLEVLEKNELKKLQKTKTGKHATPQEPKVIVEESLLRETYITDEPDQIAL